MGEARRRRIEAARAGVPYVPTHNHMKQLEPVNAFVDAALLDTVKTEFDEYRRNVPALKYDTWIETLLTQAVAQARGERLAAAAPPKGKTVQIEPYSPERAAEIAAGGAA